MYACQAGGCIGQPASRCGEPARGGTPKRSGDGWLPVGCQRVGIELGLQCAEGLQCT